MNPNVFQIATSYVTYFCTTCNVPIPLPLMIKNLRVEDGKAWYCLNGHQNHFGETENAKLKRQLVNKEAELKWAQDARTAAFKREDKAKKVASAYKGCITKIKRRVQNGVCPCCNRTFQNLQRHMTAKHPAWEKEEIKRG